MHSLKRLARAPGVHGPEGAPPLLESWAGAPVTDYDAPEVLFEVLIEVMLGPAENSIARWKLLFALDEPAVEQLVELAPDEFAPDEFAPGEIAAVLHEGPAHEPLAVLVRAPALLRASL